jgi:acyl-[acyl carrier protein]--UDP-N-acetylglucosamine O-acyltransferase
MNNIKTLQENLAKDLVELEESNINEETLKKIEEVYKSIYDSISAIDKEKD